MHSVSAVIGVDSETTTEFRMEVVLYSPSEDLNYSKSTHEWWFPEEFETENEGPYHCQCYQETLRGLGCSCSRSSFLSHACSWNHSFYCPE